MPADPARRHVRRWPKRLAGGRGADRRDAGRPAEGSPARGRGVSDRPIAVERVSLAFGGGQVIRDVSFDIVKGEIRAIIGPNGAGKTSMLNIINGLYQPQRGAIVLKGVRYDRLRPRDAATNGIARTFQN